MSAVVVIAPVVVAAWPIVAASVVSAAAACGFKIVKTPKQQVPKNAVTLDLDNADILAESLSQDDRIVVERNGVRVIFSRDGRGKFSTCVEGDLSKEDLRAIGEDLSGRVVQQYVFRRLSQELEKNGFVTLSEEAGPDESIRLHVRRFEE